MLFVFNPKSGRGQIKNGLADIIDVFVKGGYDVVVYPTQGKDDARNKIIKSAEEFDTITVSGGDGTLNEAVSALMSVPKAKRPYLGYIPAGTTNDFAASCNIPKSDMHKAAQNIVKSTPAEIDVGKICGKYFSYIAAFGAFTDVSYETPQQTKNILGFSAYVLEGIKRLGNIKPHHIKISCNEKIIENDFIFGMVSNSFSVGGIRYGDNMDVSLNDGIFECVLVKKPTNPIDFQFTIADLLTANMKSDKFIFLKTSEILFEADEQIDWTIDGEFGGSYKKARIINKKRAVRILAGSD